MSIAEVKRFSEALKTNADLRSEVEKAVRTAPANVDAFDYAISFAKGKGYDFTAAEIHEFGAANEQSASSKLDDSSLAGVVGGAFDPFPVPEGFKKMFFGSAVGGPVMAIAAPYLLLAGVPPQMVADMASGKAPQAPTS